MYEPKCINCILTLIRFFLNNSVVRLYNAEQCLRSLIEKWQKALDIGDHAGALLTDLSKVFDCIDHELLLAKPNAYCFESRSLYFLYSYLENRKQRVKVNSSYNDFDEILTGVSQESTLGLLLFNLYIRKLFIS